jgi:hypothetical protein
MLFMANAYSNENDFAMRCQRVIDLLSKWSEQFGDTWMPYRDISRKLRWNRREHEDIRNALVDQERIETDSVVSGGRPKIVYRLRSLKRGAT